MLPESSFLILRRVFVYLAVKWNIDSLVLYPFGFRCAVRIVYSVWVITPDSTNRADLLTLVSCLTKARLAGGFGPTQAASGLAAFSVFLFLVPHFLYASLPTYVSSRI